MPETQYLSAADVVALHDSILALMGQSFSPLVHPDKLESAVARCRNVGLYEGGDLVRQAVIPAVAVSQSQAFLDGSKRAGFAAADVLLRLDGLVVCGPPLKMARFIEAVAEAERGEPRDRVVDDFERWPRNQVTPQAYEP